ncbi:MAG: TIGR04149 family rSAM-modified RiPP [Bacteroidetes bacterium]|nr:TIGR04149 family rSAM-modified RiPP [Bacteroidota bacterium]MCL2302410.1 TIGR04149 family rSAM-modified RiPP [Lentimicrobiaceae bacterium]
MKNLKLNKLAVNRLNEKEMRGLIGGKPHLEYNVVCNKDSVCCDAMCSCPITLPFNIVSGVGVTSAASGQNALA